MTKLIEKIRLDIKFNRGVRRASSGEFQKALEIFNELAKRVPDMALAHANAGFCLFRLGKTPEAIAAYEKARKLEPQDPQHAYDMGCVLYTSGQKEKSLDCFVDVLKVSPGHKDAAAALEKVRVDLKIPESDPRLKSILPAAPAPAAKPDAPKQEKATAPVKPATPVKTPPPAKPVQAAKPEVVNALIEKGQDLYEQGEFNAALAAWTEAARLAPNNAKPHNNRAAALYELGKHQEAIEACSEALRVQPGYAIAHMTRGEIYAAMGNRDAVMREYTALNAIDEELAQELIDLIRNLKEQES